MEGDTDGVEVWGNLSVREWWRVSAGANWFHKDLRLVPGTRDIFGVSFAGNDPSYQWSVSSDADLPRGLTFDVSLREVASLANPAVDSYLEAAARLGWQATKTLNVSVEGRNLLHAHHLEFVNPSIKPSEVPRSFTLSAHWTP